MQEKKKNPFVEALKWIFGLFGLVGIGYALWVSYNEGNLFGYTFKVDKEA